MESLDRIFYHSHRIQGECQAQPQMAEGGIRRKCQQWRPLPVNQRTHMWPQGQWCKWACVVRTPVISASRSLSRRKAVSQGHLRLHGEFKASRRYVVKLWQIHSETKWEVLWIGFWKCKGKLFCCCWNFVHSRNEVICQSKYKIHQHWTHQCGRVAYSRVTCQDLFVCLFVLSHWN